MLYNSKSITLQLYQWEKKPRKTTEEMDGQCKWRYRSKEVDCTTSNGSDVGQKQTETSSSSLIIVEMMEESRRRGRRYCTTSCIYILYTEKPQQVVIQPSPSRNRKSTRDPPHIDVKILYSMRLHGLVVSALRVRTRWPRFDSRVVVLFLGQVISQLQETGVQKGSFRRLSGYGD